MINKFKKKVEEWATKTLDKFKSKEAPSAENSFKVQGYNMEQSQKRFEGKPTFDAFDQSNMRINRSYYAFNQFKQMWNTPTLDPSSGLSGIGGTSFPITRTSYTVGYDPYHKDEKFGPKVFKLHKKWLKKVSRLIDVMQGPQLTNEEIAKRKAERLTYVDSQEYMRIQNQRGIGIFDYKVQNTPLLTRSELEKSINGESDKFSFKMPYTLDNVSLPLSGVSYDTNYARLQDYVNVSVTPSGINFSSYWDKSESKFKDDKK